MISVIMPAYNAEKFIRPAIESILNQTYKDFEFIIVDDGSTDSTVEIIQEYESQDPRLTLIQNQHGGGNRARNTAIDMAKHEWVACLDADDVAYPNRLERQLEYLEANPDIVVLGSYMDKIDVEGNIIGHTQVGPTSVEAFKQLDRTKHVAVVVNPSAIFNRKIALQVGKYDERLTAAQEVELWDRMSAFGPVVVLPESLVQYRIHGNSTSVKKYFEQRMYHDFIVERYKAKLQGKTLTLEQHLKNYKGLPILRRIIRDMRIRGGLHYRIAGVRVANKQYGRAIFSLIIALILRPKFTVRRIFQQLFPGHFTRIA